ncbi:hypothetical protein GA0115259_108715 [Streptomyces sp. MnatMP-M17]|nr:hypothetical protein GA0115259_108715 [Streptomyces sp. MnatMP-M17]
MPCVPLPDEVGDDGQELVLEASGRAEAVCGRVARRSAQLTPDAIDAASERPDLTGQPLPGPFPATGIRTVTIRRRSSLMR